MVGHFFLTKIGIAKINQVSFRSPRLASEMKHHSVSLKTTTSDCSCLFLVYFNSF